MLKQSIDLPGIGNALELGGYSTGYGWIKPGLLLRTVAMNNMMPDTVNKLMNEFRLQYVIDFRMTGEQSAVPDPDIPGARNIHLSVIEIEDYPIDDPELIEVYHKCSDRVRFADFGTTTAIRQMLRTHYLSSLNALLRRTYFIGVCSVLPLFIPVWLSLFPA